MKKIILTGGGSAGHVTPNLALVPKLKALGYDIVYIGSKEGIEKNIIQEENIKYKSISCGKFRRYFDIKNFSDPFKVIKGINDAKKIIKEEKPCIVFSKGGFVSVPVVIGAYLNKVPVIAHESDITPGLANKISTPFCTKVCVTFPESLSKIGGGKAVLTGTPIRKELLEGSKLIGRKICDFTDNKKTILVIGGSLGSKIINQMLRSILDKLLINFNVINICGKGNIDNSIQNKGYKQFEFVSEELPHLLALSDYVISRAGANVIFELLALKKPNILIPLSKKSSRGDQILNAESFRKSGYSIVIQEADLTGEELINKLEELIKNSETFVKAMEQKDRTGQKYDIIDLIKQYSNMK